MSRNALTGVTPGLWRNKRATQTRIHVTERASRCVLLSSWQRLGEMDRKGNVNISAEARENQARIQKTGNRMNARALAA